MRLVLGPVVRSAAAAVAVVLTLSGCFNTQPQTTNTNQEQTTSGANVDAGRLQVRNLLVRVDRAGDAQVTGAVYNTSRKADRIASVTVAGSPATTVGEAVLPPATQTLLGPSGVRITAPAASLEPGLVTEVVLTFDGAPETKARVLVMNEATVAEDTLS